VQARTEIVSNIKALPGTMCRMASTRRPGRPSMPDDETSNVHRLLKRVLKELYEDNGSKLGEALGVTGSAISQQKSGRNRPSFELIRALAAVLDVDESAVRSGELLDAPLKTPDIYPARARALRRLRGLIPLEVVVAVQSVRIEHGSPFSEFEWVEVAVDRTAKFHRASGLEGRFEKP